MKNYYVFTVIFASGLTLGWYGHRHWAQPDGGALAIPLPPTAIAPPSPDAAPGPARRAQVGGPPRLRHALDAARAPEPVSQTRVVSIGVSANAETRLARAGELIRQGRYHAAEELLRGHLLEAHRDVEAHMLLAEVYAGRKQYPQAIDALYAARGYAYRPDTLERASRRIRALVAEQAAILKRSGDAAGLLQLYQHLTQLEPSHAPWFLGLAHAQLALEDTAAARRSLLLVEQDPEVGRRARALLEELSLAGSVTPEPDRVALAKQAVGVPLHRSGDHFLVDARLNDIQPVRLLIDTGASMTILTPGTLERSGVRYTDTGASRVFSTANGRVRAPVYRLDALSVGSWQVTELDIGVLDMGGESAIDGLLGMNFLRHFQFFIDQNAALLRLSLERL
jgi:clan AA aspartic protease (TIGR02281 family)